MPLENIKQVPIALFISEFDQSCSYDQAFEHLVRINSEVTPIVVKDMDHFYYGTTANTEDFMDKLIA